MEDVLAKKPVKGFRLTALQAKKVPSVNLASCFQVLSNFLHIFLAGAVLTVHAIASGVFS